MTKKGAVVGVCYTMCKPNDCAAAQELLKGREIAEMIMIDCKKIEDEMSNNSKYIGTITNSRGGSKNIRSHCKKNAKRTSVTLACPKHIKSK